MKLIFISYFRRNLYFHIPLWITRVLFLCGRDVRFHNFSYIGYTIFSVIFYFMLLYVVTVFLYGWIQQALSFSCEPALGKVGCDQMFLVPESCGITGVGEVRKDLLRDGMGACRWRMGRILTKGNRGSHFVWGRFLKKGQETGKQRCSSLTGSKSVFRWNGEIWLERLILATTWRS